MSAGFQREINILGEPTSDRSSKKQALERIYKELKNPSLDSAQVLDMFHSMSKHILKMFVDPIEKCRELSIKIIARYILLISVVGRAEQVQSLLVLLVPVFESQLTSIKVVEPSEVF